MCHLSDCTWVSLEIQGRLQIDFTNRCNVWNLKYRMLEYHVLYNMFLFKAICLDMVGWFLPLGRAVLQKRIMALLRKIDQSTTGNTQVWLLASPSAAKAAVIMSCAVRWWFSVFIFHS